MVPTPPAPPAPDAAGADKAGTGESREIDVTKIQRGSRLPWALLLKRVFMACFPLGKGILWVYRCV